MHHNEFVDHCYVLGLSVISRTAEREGTGDWACFWVAERLQVHALAHLQSWMIVNYNLLLLILRLLNTRCKQIYNYQVQVLTPAESTSNSEYDCSRGLREAKHWLSFLNITLEIRIRTLNDQSHCNTSGNWWQMERMKVSVTPVYVSPYFTSSNTLRFDHLCVGKLFAPNTSCGLEALRGCCSIGTEWRRPPWSGTMLVSRGPGSHRKESRKETGCSNVDISINIYSKLCEWYVLCPPLNCEVHVVNDDLDWP